MKFSEIQNRDKTRDQKEPQQVAIEERIPTARSGSRKPIREPRDEEREP